jgi:hypothetical protein
MDDVTHVVDNVDPSIAIMAGVVLVLGFSLALFVRVLAHHGMVRRLRLYKTESN